MKPRPVGSKKPSEEGERKKESRVLILLLLTFAAAMASCSTSFPPRHSCLQHRATVGLRLRGGRPKKERDPDILMSNMLRSCIKNNVKLFHDMMHAVNLLQVTASTPWHDLMPKGERDRDPLKTEFEELKQETRDKSKICYRSLNWKLVRKSVLCITIEDDHTRQAVGNMRIMDIRDEFDKENVRWKIPTIILFHSFFEREDCHEAGEALEQELKTLETCSITFTGVRTDKDANGESAVGFNILTFPRAEWIKRLRRRVVSRFPSLEPLEEVFMARQHISSSPSSQVDEVPYVPHVQIGTFDSVREAEAKRANFEQRLMNLTMEANSVSICCHSAMKFEVFSIFRDIPISGQNYLKFRESEAEEELHVFSEAEENLDSSEHADVAIVKRWNPITKKFENVGGDFLSLESARKDKDDKDLIEFKLKAEDGARLFMRQPSRYQKRHKSSLKKFVESMNMTKVSKLFKYLKDIGHLSRHSGFLIVHKKISRELKAKNAKRADLRRRLKAMKARDKTEKEELKKVKEKMEVAEERVMRNFRKRLSDRDKRILDKKMAKMRQENEESASNIEDPQLRDLYKRFDPDPNETWD
ncbi:hypothetical protein GUITHDRAFT_138084 [Guillardia theta CCMP2712]|uniref:Uncharacterized protein n=1 Tax=Guillardia theta (strain CCMP2712) TaxID=905079 RepID=L1JDW0_GUITC|nr:hypothetical protein GUITHDRAFT_138084 [Guillardia theta CCMP2712]EKX46723.1 hypothetical protein GUITHDRAFT_138084 [Guillardia theta CCMP2712]|eukprot:XP_005833703.1 hypothetical protein GUITHDRAFT_138084 [Guillardia theta CCMP2712]